jgi:hypothetical protein
MHAIVGAAIEIPIGANLRNLRIESLRFPRTVGAGGRKN